MELSSPLLTVMVSFVQILATAILGKSHPSLEEWMSAATASSSKAAASTEVPS